MPSEAQAEPSEAQASPLKLRRTREGGPSEAQAGPLKLRRMREGGPSEALKAVTMGPPSERAPLVNLRLQR